MTPRAAPGGAACVVTLSLMLTACGAGSAPTPTPAPSSPAPGCRALPSATGPDVSGSLGEGDAGGTFCLRVGEKLTVFLRVPPDQAATDAWRAITASDTTVLQATANGALSLAVGVTGASFVAAATGTSRLTSTRPPCPSTAPTACPAGQGWEATIVVRT